MQQVFLCPKIKIDLYGIFFAFFIIKIHVENNNRLGQECYLENGIFGRKNL